MQTKLAQFLTQICDCKVILKWTETNESHRKNHLSIFYEKSLVATPLVSGFYKSVYSIIVYDFCEMWSNKKQSCDFFKRHGRFDLKN